MCDIVCVIVCVSDYMCGYGCFPCVYCHVIQDEGEDIETTLDALLSHSYPSYEFEEDPDLLDEPVLHMDMQVTGKLLYLTLTFDLAYVYTSSMSRVT